MREKPIEEYLRDEVKRIGGRAFKFVSPGNDGVPDRLVCLPGGLVVFVETKAAGKKSTKLQRLQQRRLESLGFTVFKDIDSKAKVDQVIEYCRELIENEI
jgi:hypothetical protein